jgi:7-keto-8-aminopelargonate synthetase-like enzyme
MDKTIHRFRNNQKAVALGNPAWDEAQDHHLIDLVVEVAGNDRLRDESTGFEFVNLSSCSYLGLHNHPEILQGAIEGLQRSQVLWVPVSRIRMRLGIMDEVEAGLSELFRAHCITTVTASAATAGVLPLVASGHLSDGKPPVMVFDKYCHFSMNLIKPICADETEVLTSPHNDVNFVEDACKKHSRVAYVADGAYSLGGAAPVKELLELQDRYGLFLFFDDSHSLSVYGEHGEGYARALMGAELNPLTIIVASLGKAFGGTGGVIMLGSPKNHALTVRFGGPLAWSQWPNSAGLGAALASIRLHNSPLLGELQGRLRQNLALFDSRIGTEEKGGASSSIRMVLIGDEVRTSEVSGEIFRRGFYTSPVFFPVVERGKAGLRVMIRADNDPKDLMAFCDAVEDLTGGAVPEASEAPAEVGA